MDLVSRRRLAWALGGTLLAAVVAGPLVPAAAEDMPTLAAPKPTLAAPSSRRSTADSSAAGDSSGTSSDGPAIKPADDKPAASDAKPTYLLRYVFQPGETLRWEVEHRAQVKTTVSGTTQTADTTSHSVKVWKIMSVDTDGKITFIHSVESVDMRQKLSGRQEVHYNSQVDKDAPAGFQDVAKSVGVPLSVITMDRQGKILKREEKHVQSGPQSTHMAIPLPAGPVEIGAEWSVPYDVTANTTEGSPIVVKMRQHMSLESVNDGVAVITLDTQMLSPIRDPAVLAQLVQGESLGRVRFDMDAGRVIGQQTDSDKNVVGFQGQASSLHYVTRFVEKLLPSGDRTAARAKPVAGPALPPAAQPLPAAKPKAPAAKSTFRDRRP